MGVSKKTKNMVLAHPLHIQGDHSPVNVKFLEISLTFCGTPIQAALTRTQSQPIFSPFALATLTLLQMLTV